ncbi:MAG TPA: MFS transporter [Acidimicrobiales bacterium]|nr:MFS transporter [Acidimicrobiales bacterium]
MKLRRFADVTAGRAALPLALLFVLNLVDELDQVAFGVVAPEVADSFGISESTAITLTTIAGALVITAIVPIGYLADRYSRVRMTALAAILWTSMSMATGLAGFVGFLPLLAVARFGSGLGRVMNEPVHASLLADYYPPESHGKVFSLHRMANPLGLMLVLGAGTLTQLVGWQWTFVLIALPSIPALLLVSRLTEPTRGASINMGLATAAEEHAERIPLGEAWRRLAAIPTLKRSWVAAFFLGAGVIPITSFFAFFYENEYNLGPGAWGRAGVVALFGLGTLIGLEVGSRLSTATIMSGEPEGLALRGGLTLVGVGVSLLAMAVAPWVGLSVALTFVVGLFAAFQSYNLPLVAAVSPPRLRSQAFAWFGLWFAAGAILLAPIIATVGEDHGYRLGIGWLAVIVAVSGLIYMSSRKYVRRDALQALKALQTEAGVRDARDKGGQALLVCSEVEVAYGQVQVLFGVDLEVRPGEIVALLGTNGAGKSTLLGAISGLVEPMGGTIWFDGRDVTHSDGNQTAAAGIVQVPGGRAIFPTLTVAEHLRAAGWLYRQDAARLRTATEEVWQTFPRLRERMDQMAGTLSGGEQQMLALGMAFVATPRLLMIDELSLGLAPTVVDQLLKIVRRIRDQGTAVILVEQSVNVALTIADRCYFMEKGEVRFEGQTSDLLERGDLIRSVFLEGAGASANGRAAEPRAAAVRNVRSSPPASRQVVLELSGVSKHFGGIQAVDNVDLTLHDGEILGLIGPNGAGKTTLLDLISGFEIPDSGRIELLTATAGQAGVGGGPSSASAGVGRPSANLVDVTDWSPDRRAWLGLGRSFQDARLVPSLTVAENLAIGLERHMEQRDHVASALGLPLVVQQEQDVAWTVEDLVDLMNLGAFRDKFVSELSTGSRRIVDLAMCIAHDPKVLLLDEPSSGIAQAETEALGPLLRRIQQETGCSLLVIEHDMPLITSMSDQIMALELGHPLTQGPPEDVIRDPRVVSSYLGGDLAVVNRSGRPAPSGNGSARPRRARVRHSGSPT